jgi:5'-nucleotidase / UDP-sugar diphosphatase
VYQVAKKGLVYLGVVAALSGCLGGGNGGSAVNPSDSLPTTAFELQVLHIADMDSGGNLVENSQNISAVLSKFRAEKPDNTVFLSSGDNYIPGSFFNASADTSLQEELGVPSAGRGDIEILNQLGLDASAFGNHDFDQGTAKVLDLIAPETVGADTWRGAQFPYLSANIDFSGDTNLASLADPANDGQEASSLAGKIAKFAVITVNGEQVGVVSAATPTLPNITTLNGATVSPALDGSGNFSIDDLASEIQPSINVLLNRGIDKIILLGHMQQISVEEQLATRLTGVDLIIAGGSNTRLFDSNDLIRAGDTNQGEYPKQFTSASGEPVLLVNVDADYKYLGRIVLPFDEDGEVIVERLDPTVNGAYSTDAAGLAALGLDAADVQPEVAAIARDVLAVNQALEGVILGSTSVYLEGDRTFVRKQESNLGNLTADANLAAGQDSDMFAAVSLKNGGGIRGSIGTILVPPGGTGAAQKLPPQADESVGKQEGDISRGDIERALSFNNALTLLNVTAQQLKDLLEHGVSSYDLAAAQGVGAFPQIGGMRFSFDPTAAPGSRVRTIVVNDPDGLGPLMGPQTVFSDGQFRVPVNQVYRMVTLSFLADGGDGYPFPMMNVNRVDLDATGDADFAIEGREQQALADFLEATTSRATPFMQADSGADITVDERIVILANGRVDPLPQ